jgi:uncharacterized protein (TIGR03000 family)
MYSVVLMMAMATGGDVPTFGRGGCYGACTGCQGTIVVVNAGCTGGTSCHGYTSCRGGGFLGLRHSCHGGGFLGLRHSCRGGCVGTGCTGGVIVGGGCVGTGCTGGVIVGGCYGGVGCVGGTPVIVGGGCTGTPVVHPPAVTPTEPKKEEKKQEKKEEKKEDKEPKTSINAPATIVVSLPADAKLTVDGVATRSTSEIRSFVTPTLAAGRTFQYTLAAEVVRNGRPIVETRNVTVRAGQTSNVVFTLGSESVASAN